MSGPPVAVGDRVRLTGAMHNGDSSIIPVEDLPVGTEGTVVWVGQWTSLLTKQFSVNWDNGSRLNILDGDSYEVINPE